MVDYAVFKENPSKVEHAFLAKVKLSEDDRIVIRVFNAESGLYHEVADLQVGVDI